MLLAQAMSLVLAIWMVLALKDHVIERGALGWNSVEA
jgi:hypothetical protein